MSRLAGQIVAGLLLLAASMAVPSGAQAAPKPIGASRIDMSKPGLQAFRSDRELRAFIRRLAGNRPPPPPAPPPPPPPPPPPAPSSSAPASAQPYVDYGQDSAIMVTGSRIAQPNLESTSPVTTVAGQPNITNRQEADVDEGGIVKVHGQHLVILRRGRLFTVSMAGGSLRPVASIDAYPPGAEAQGDWYDEMLVSGDRVIVIGYSYERGGTEINRFRIGRDGSLRFEDAHHLRSNDYYSDRNYASRLIGSTLIFYTPLELELDGETDPLDLLPGLRRWREGGEELPFKRIAGARQIFIPPVLKNGKDVEIDTLHSVVTCDLAASELDCSAIGVLGPESRNFYVSGRAVYLWIADAWNDEEERRGPAAFIYRLPLGPERPSAIGARGVPVDQFSFREDAREGVLNVLVRSEGGGDAMWRPEATAGDVALLRVPLSQFRDGSREAALRFYRALPRPGDDQDSFRNRYVGDHLLYGTGAFTSVPGGSSTLFAVPVRGGTISALPLPHGVDRIEPLGRDALVVGGGEGDLAFTAVVLDAAAVKLGSRYVHPKAAEGESRSHAFFFRPDAATPGGESGLLGLPVSRKVEPAYQRLFGSAASMLFLRRDRRLFSPAGELASDVRGAVDDACVASCVDWYGNARPIFLGDRVFALLGYELVEGSLDAGRVREVLRVDFAPGFGSGR